MWRVTEDCVGSPPCRCFFWKNVVSSVVQFFLRWALVILQTRMPQYSFGYIQLQRYPRQYDNPFKPPHHQQGMQACGYRVFVCVHVFLIVGGFQGLAGALSSLLFLILCSCGRICARALKRVHSV